jgi:hypothetical protein
MSLAQRSTSHAELNHRQQLALDRVELAVGELSSVLLSCCSEQAVSRAAMGDIRKAVAPVLDDILSVG